MAKIVRFKNIFKEGHPLSLNDLHTTQYKPGEDELTNYRAYRRKRLSEDTQLDEIQIGWHHKTQKYHTIKHTDGSHYGVYDHSSYGTNGYEIRKIKDKDGNSLRAKESRSSKHADRYMSGPKGGPTAAAKKWVAQHGGKIVQNHKVEESVEENSVDESLNISQRLARQRMFKRYRSKIKLGRQRAKRKMANQSVLQRRSIKQARSMILKKITKGASKDELSFARRQDLEKRLEKPQMQKRIKLLAKRIYKDVRKREVERKKG